MTQPTVRAGVVDAQGSTVKGDERGRWTRAKDEGRGRRTMDEGEGRRTRAKDDGRGRRTMDNGQWSMDGNSVFLATKVAWRRKEGKYKVGVISTPYNSDPTSRSKLRDGNPKNLLGPSRPPASFLSTPGSWCRVFTHTTTLILVQSFHPHHYPDPGAEFSPTPLP